ncbi:MAG: hypothetical protein COB04_17895 [Gammaproteobacteria bacterium]|nr:MAG: hypothetical protein COB04_17895 [Gammaproteobacteria bacterium]
MIQKQHLLKPLIYLATSILIAPLQCLAAAPDQLTLDIVLESSQQTTPQVATETGLLSACSSLGNLADGQRSPQQDNLLVICSSMNQANQSELDNFHEQLSPKYASSLSKNITTGNNTSRIRSVSNRSSARPAKRSKNTQADATYFESDSGNYYGDYSDVYQNESYFYKASFSPSNLTDSENGQFDNLNELLKRVDAFASVYTLHATKDATIQDSGYENDTISLLLGGNYRYTNKFIIGTALELAYSELALNPQKGGIEIDNYNLSLFGSYLYKPQWIFDASIYTGIYDYQTSRDVIFFLGGAPSIEKINSSTDAFQWGLSLNTSYSWNYNNGIELTALGKFTYINAEVDGYEEQGSTGFELIVDDQENQNASTDITIETRRAYGFSWGSLIPQISITWIHELDEEAAPVISSFAADPDASLIAFNTDEFDQDYFNFLVGSYIGLPRGLSGFAQLETILDLDDYTSTNFSIGIRTELK